MYFERLKVRSALRSVAKDLAYGGDRAEALRAKVLDIAKSEALEAAEEAIAWAAKHDAEEAADRDDFADECETEARREREREIDS
jgi:hypothetical protein